MNILRYSDQNFFPPIQSRTEEIQILSSSKGILCFRQDHDLLVFSYNAGEWRKLYEKNVFEMDQRNFTKTDYPWFFSNELNVIIIHSPQGIRFYRPDEENFTLKLLSTDRRFQDLYGYGNSKQTTIMFGNFYPNQNVTGVMIRNKFNEIKFYGVVPESLSEEKRYPLFELSDLFLSSKWKTARNELFVTDFDNQKQSSIGLRTPSGLELFKFDKDYRIMKIFETKQIKKSGQDRLYFCNLTSQNYQDILQLNSSGLFVFQYNESKTDYSFLHQHKGFGDSYGWLQAQSETIHFADVNQDKRDDLIFTGHQGLTALSFDSSNYEWEVILDSKHLWWHQKFSSVVGVLPPMLPEIKDSSFFMQDQNGKLQWAQLYKGIIPANEFKSVQDLYHLRWSERINQKHFKNLIDTANGQVRFSFPIVDTSSMSDWKYKLEAHYNSDNLIDTLLGVGWSIDLAQDFILVDYQQSIFPEDAEYYLVSQSYPQKLKIISKEQTKLSFVIDNSDDNNIKLIEFYPDKQTWVIEGDVEKIIYGQSKGALQFSLQWPNWRGKGSDIENLQPYVTAWYLSSRESKQNYGVLHYEYETEFARIESSKAYTKSIRLKSIRDSKKLKINFEYEPKMMGQFYDQDPRDKDGNIFFPSDLSNSHCLKSLELRSTEYIQTIHFNFKEDNKKLFLTSIDQITPFGTEKVMKFEYRDFLMSQFKLATGFETEFEYKNFPSIRTGQLTSALIHQVEDKPKIFHGSDFSIISYLKSDKVMLRIMDKQLTKTIGETSTNCFPNIQDFAVKIFKSSFIVITESKQNQLLTFFERHEPHFKLTSSLNLSKESLIIINEDSITLAEDQQIMIYENESYWSQTANILMQKQLTRLVQQKKLIIAYDDNDLWLVIKSENSTWKTKHLISEKSELQNIFYRFDITEDIRKEYIKVFNKNGLQVINNFVAFNSVQEKNNKLSSHIKLFLLDEKYQISKTQTFIKEQGNILNLRYELKENGSQFNFKYKLVDNTFKLYIDSASGAVVEDVNAISNKNNRSDAMSDKLKALNNDKTWKTFCSQTVILNFNQYMIQMVQNGVTIGNETFFRNTGTGWISENIRQSEQAISLGKYFSLEASNDEKTLILIAQSDGKVLKVFHLSSSSFFVNRYPFYIANQASENIVEVLTFKNEATIDQSYYFHGEQLRQESDFQNLITAVMKTSDVKDLNKYVEFRVRHLLNTFTSKKSQKYVSKFALITDDTKQVKEYEHDTVFDSKAFDLRETVTIVPGGNKRLAGSIEVGQTYNLKTGNTTTVELFFDSNDEKVLKPIKKESKSRTEENSQESNSSFLFDLEGKWIISDFSPYEEKDEMVAYYGFESYEKNSVFKLFNAEIIAREFSYTGENFLQLKQNSSIEATFTPKNQGLVYIATCWIRTKTPLQINSPTPILKASLSTTDGDSVITLHSQVKRKSGDWFYVELPVDLKLVREIFENIYKNTAEKSFQSSPRSAKFMIKLRVSSEHQSIDLDHIRFTPIKLNFKASIYHPITGQVTAILQANGLFTRTILNRYHDEIAEIDENGLLEVLTTKTQTGNLISLPVLRIQYQKPSFITFIPSEGFYETFDSFSIQNRWIIDNLDAWKTIPGQLSHQYDSKDRVQLNANIFDESSGAIRCFFALKSNYAILSFGDLKLTRNGNFASLNIADRDYVSSLPIFGEIIIMREDSSLWIWFDGVLIVDQSFSRLALLFIEAHGQVLIEDLFIINKPQLKIEYKNSFDDTTQIIQLVDADTINVTEILFDEIGRKAITTKTTRITRDMNQPLLNYRPNFILNKNPSDPQSVWKIGELKGEANDLNPKEKGFAYVRSEFAKNPFNEKIAIGLPGIDFSVGGPFSTKFSQKSNSLLLDILFPTQQGFTQNVEYQPNGSKKISVFNSKALEVASYVEVPSFNHLLTVYEYDEKDNLVKILPPLYHEKVNTARKLQSWDSTKDLTENEKKWQKSLATFFTYDNAKHLIRKITPDSGTIEFIYDSAGQKHFTIRQNSTIIYYSYDQNRQLIETGFVNQSLTFEQLQKFANNKEMLNLKKFQQIDFCDDNPDPQSRGRIKRLITHNYENLVIDELHYDSRQQIIAKSTVSPFKSSVAEMNSKFTKEYNGDHLTLLSYPVQVNGKPLKLFHKTNRLGKLMELRLNDETLVRFEYNADGHLHTESNKYFNRTFLYSSPGYLEKISDPFLIQEFFYTEGGYGQNGNGDGIVMKTSFNATWSDSVDRRWFQVTEKDLKDYNSSNCFDGLVDAGYLSEFKVPLKLYSIKNDQYLPLVCDRKSIATILSKKQPPRYYGHQYAIGSHKELIKAKYFTEDTVHFTDPLQPDSFNKEIKELTLEQSKEIWKILVETGFIISDQQKDNPETAVGKPGKPLIRREDLKNDLKQLKEHYFAYWYLIEIFLLKQECLSLDCFKDSFLKWSLNSPGSHTIKEATDIGEMLVDQQYFTNPFDRNLITSLSAYLTFVPRIIKILSVHFSHSLGTTPFDVESFKIDANGNHRHFYIGFDRYELEYHEYSNQINKIYKDGKIYPVLHDSEGNVIQALHKNIQKIEYHPVSQRTTKIELTDGKVLKFFYDAQGERVLKQILSPSGKIVAETYYLRDEKGQVLVDQRFDYLKSQQIITAYIYGPRGLLGFIRNDQFFEVTTDHAGSIRLIIKNGQVVAAYDYLPYGELMRSFGTDPEAQIMYRYTGQEFDEETGLYNYHARLYDPTIGRFYQIDPQAQYHSPYVYAGNSPVSMIDPDGELAFIIPVVFALAGAYLGGSTANNRWNPLDWDWEDQGTYFGIGGGLIAGGFLPLSVFGSVAALGGGALGFVGTIGAGVGGAYLTTAATNKNWDPTKWDWSRPKTWNGIFQGIGSGTGLVGGFGMAHKYGNDLARRIFEARYASLLTSSGSLSLVQFKYILDRSLDAALLAKKVFLITSYATGAGIAYSHGVLANGNNFKLWEWDFSSPETLSSLVDGFDTGFGWPQNALEITRGVTKIWGRGVLKSFKTLKNLKNPLYKVILGTGMAYYMASAANGNFDVTKWNFANGYSAFGTYEAIINGVFFGKDITNMLKFIEASQESSKLKSKETSFQETFARDLRMIEAQQILAEYKYKIEDFFQNNLWKSTLNDFSDIIKAKIEDFFNAGVDQWKNGKSTLPAEFNQAILNELWVKTQTSRELKFIAEKYVEIQRTIFPEEITKQLGCRSLGRRKRNPLNACTLRNPEKFVEIFNQELLPNIPVIHTTADLNFYKFAIIGMVINSNEVKNFKVEHTFEKIQIEIISPNEEKGKTEIQVEKKEKPVEIHVDFESLKITNEKKEKTESQVEKKEKPVDIPVDFKCTKITVTDEFGTERVYYLTTDPNLPTKVLKDHVRDNIIKIREKIEKSIETENVKSGSKYDLIHIKKDKITDQKFEVAIDYKNNYDNTEVKREPTFSGKEENQRLQPQMVESLSNFVINSDIIQKKTSIETFVEDILKSYLSIKAPNSKEADIQGYFYGLLTDMKKHFDMDILAEAISGNGYADLMLLVHSKLNDGSFDWNGIPIIFELKNDKTTVEGAIHQIDNTAYLYNLPLKTIAEKALVIGINPEIKNTDTKYKVEIRDIPKTEGIIRSFTSFCENINDAARSNEMRTKINSNLMHLAYLVPFIATKEGCSILGYTKISILTQITWETEIKNIHVIKFKNEPSKIYFELKSQGVLLNFLDKSAQTFETSVPSNSVANNVVQLDIINQPVNGKPDRLFKVDDHKLFHRADLSLENTSWEKIECNKEFDFLKTSTLSQEEKIKIFKHDLAKNIQTVKEFITSESYFQSYVQASLLKASQDLFSTDRILRIFTENNLSREGRSDIIMSDIEINGEKIKENSLFVMELKCIKTDLLEIDNKLNLVANEALKQARQYGNIKAISNLKETQIYVLGVVFDKSTGKIKISADTKSKAKKNLEQLPATSSQSIPLRENNQQHHTPQKRKHLERYGSSKDTSSNTKSRKSRRRRSNYPNKNFASSLLQDLFFHNSSYSNASVDEISKNSQLSVNLISHHKDYTHEKTPEGFYNNIKIADHHVQGSLQLLDVLIRKKTGERYKNLSSSINYVDEAEAQLQASLLRWNRTDDIG